jgi:hypothetical protein
LNRRLLIVLQNAYDRGGLAMGWSPGRWRKEFLASLTGARLRHALPEGGGWELRFANACPGIGVGSGSRLTPCVRHLRRAIRRVDPDAILACGKVAAAVVPSLWDGPYFAIPHPASRVVTTELLLRCRAAILAWDAARRPRIVLRLERGMPGGLWHVLTTPDGDTTCPGNPRPARSRPAG